MSTSTYTKINFQNYPNKTTKLSSENLNHMDDGIKANNTGIRDLENNISNFKFRDNSGQAQYSMDGGTTWLDFKHPTGTKSITANGVHNVTDYASVNVKVGFDIWFYTNSYGNQDGNHCGIEWLSVQNLNRFTYTNGNTNSDVSVSGWNGSSWVALAYRDHTQSRTFDVTNYSHIAFYADRSYTLGTQTIGYHLQGYSV